MKPEPKRGRGRQKKDSVRVIVHESKGGNIRYVRCLTVYESPDKVIATLRKALKLEAGS